MDTHRLSIIKSLFFIASKNGREFFPFATSITMFPAFLSTAESQQFYLLSAPVLGLVPSAKPYN